MSLFRRSAKVVQAAKPAHRAANLPPSHADGAAHQQPGGTDGHPYGHVDSTFKPDALFHLHAGAPLYPGA